MRKDPNFYEDGGQMDYTPAPVQKSNSLTSNECTRSSCDGSIAAGATFQPLKLVLKRQSDNKYEIKNNNFDLELDENNNQLSNDAWSTSEAGGTESELSNGKRRPTRRSAQKVKFIFSDAEEDKDNDFVLPPSKKKRSNKQQHTPKIEPQQNFINNAQLMMPQFFPAQSPYEDSDIESDDDAENSLKLYQELLLKNMPQTQMLSIQNLVLQNQLQNQRLLELKMGGKLAPVQPEPVIKSEKRIRKPTKKKEIVELPPVVPRTVKKKVATRTTTHAPKTSTPRVRSRSNQRVQKQPVATCTSPIKKYRQYTEPPFTKADIQPASFIEKSEILQRKAYVVLHHSQGIPIALVENKTNFITTKAVLFIHLFMSLSSGCIWCPLCEFHLSVTEFSKHVHSEEGDDDEVDTKKTYKVLPYRIDNTQELSPHVLGTWKTFAKRYSEFKQVQVEKGKAKVPVIKKPELETKKVLVVKDMNKVKDVEVVAVKEAVIIPVPIVMKKIEFSDWEYKENDQFLISKERLANDIVYEVETERPSEVHYFMEQQDDMNLSEDESDVKSNSSQTETRKKSPIKMSFTYSPDIDTNTMNITETKTKSPDMEIIPIINTDANTNSPVDIDINTIQPLLNEMVSQVHDSFELKKVKQHLRTKRLSYDEDLMPSLPRPTLLQRYFNLYDNLTPDVLLYICDNQFTVIPDSYILYINSKRKENACELKLARSDYYQRAWLESSLDLECSRSQ